MNLSEMSREEPAALAAAVSAALIATVNVAAIGLGWSTETTAAVNLAVAGWVAVAGKLVRDRVCPVARVGNRDTDSP